MIARMYPKRTRLQIKNKWIKEEKINSAGITAALMERKKIGSFPPPSSFSDRD